MEKKIRRRAFLAGSAVVTGGLVVAFTVPSPIQRMLLAVGPNHFPSNKNNAFIRIAPDESITVVVTRLEMGQGVNTSMAQLIAEELECDWEKIRAVASGVDPVYNGPMGMMVTGGSTSIKESWMQYRRLGAGLREMLTTAAAERWQVPINELRAEKGAILHPTKGRLTYGELADDAGKLSFPLRPILKKSSDFQVIGQAKKRVDAVEKSNGQAIFGIDVKLPGMLYVHVARPVISAATLAAANESAARAIPGVVDIVKFGNKVAVLAQNTFAARRGRDALEAQWDSGADGKISSGDLMNEFKRQAQTTGKKAKSKGDAEKALGKAVRRLEAQYEFPLLAHAPMEPLNCTIDFNGDKADLYGGFQGPTFDQEAASKILDLPHEKIEFHRTYTGGSFGRRATADADWVSEACELAKIVKKPLQIVWSREDDMRGGHYRPMVYHQVTVGVDDSFALSGWHHHIVGQSIAKGTPLEFFIIWGGIEALLVEGVKDTIYELPDFRLEQTLMSAPVSALWWRSVGNTHTAYVMETMLDELAEATKTDPLKLRQVLLAKSDRHLAVLDLLQKKSGWGAQSAPEGRAWGLAIHESFGTVVGYVAEVSLEEDKPRVHRIWSAVHCGQVVNPAGAASQIEGGIVFGLSAFFHQKVELQNGEILQTNFHNYPVLRMAEMPEVSVAFVESDLPPTGLGEPGVPPIAPAVANALYQLTKKRTRVLPYSG